jgi:glycosyltransferase involved in cell wall biosynthesis
VITVVLNGEKTLEGTIKSVISQTYPNVEYIIIDGGSSDGTLDIIKKYEDYIDYWVSEPDDGIYDAMNKGVIVSTGNYLYFMGSSDKIFSTSTIFFILSKINFRVIENLLACAIKISHKNQPSYPKLSNNIPIIHHQGALFNLGKLKEIGFYDLNYKIFSDFDLILRYIKRNGVCYIDTVACEFQVGGISTSRKDLLLKLKEYSTIYLKYGGRITDGRFLLAITRILYYYFKGILKS